MTYHLICVHEFGPYAKGQMITDQDEIAKLMNDRDHHFVKIAAPEPDPAPMPAVAPRAKKAAE